MASSDAPVQDTGVTGDPEGTLRILIVEDELSTAEMLTTYFSALGYEVSQVGWGRDAVSLATTILPDLVILDIHLPDIDGYEVCARLRDQARTENTPVIFLTERRERADRLTGLELGAVDYITKPFDVQELRFRVRNALRRTSRETLLHPVTGLPTSLLIEEEMARVAQDPELTVIGVAVKGMAAFSDAYGFVTHDDVLRAIALILRNTASESTDASPFVGQLDLYQYVVVTSSGSAAGTIVERLDQRLREAISFFYPHRDWERGARSDGTEIPQLDFDVKLVPAQARERAQGIVGLRHVLGSPEP